MLKIKKRKENGNLFTIPFYEKLPEALVTFSVDESYRRKYIRGGSRGWRKHFFPIYQPPFQPCTKIQKVFTSTTLGLEFTNLSSKPLFVYMGEDQRHGPDSKLGVGFSISVNKGHGHLWKNQQMELKDFAKCWMWPWG